MYNFKALECFLAVAELGSFKLAAGRLNRSQSAVNVQIRQPEDQLGLPLFHRTTRMVRLTRQGEQLLSYVQRALREIDTGLNEIRKAASADTGELAIAAVLPHLLRDYKVEHPNVS
ncbi:DNA-binding transcriptional LysR family regulator [Roseovarius sp. MBR-79]|jgi:DNA-binding transcriptional LysR family regulator